MSDSYNKCCFGARLSAVFRLAGTMTSRSFNKISMDTISERDENSQSQSQVTPRTAALPPKKGRICDSPIGRPMPVIFADRNIEQTFVESSFVAPSDLTFMNEFAFGSGSGLLEGISASGLEESSVTTPKKDEDAGGPPKPFVFASYTPQTAVQSSFVANDGGKVEECVADCTQPSPHIVQNHKSESPKPVEMESKEAKMEEVMKPLIFADKNIEQTFVEPSFVIHENEDFGTTNPSFLLDISTPARDIALDETVETPTQPAETSVCEAAKMEQTAPAEMSFVNNADASVNKQFCFAEESMITNTFEPLSDSPTQEAPITADLANETTSATDDSLVKPWRPYFFPQMYVNPTLPGLDSFTHKQVDDLDASLRDALPDSAEMEKVCEEPDAEPQPTPRAPSTHSPVVASPACATEPFVLCRRSPDLAVPVECSFAAVDGEVVSEGASFHSNIASSPNCATDAPETWHTPEVQPRDSLSNSPVPDLEPVLGHTGLSAAYSPVACDLSETDKSAFAEDNSFDARRASGFARSASYDSLKSFVATERAVLREFNLLNFEQEPSLLAGDDTTSAFRRDVIKSQPEAEACEDVQEERAQTDVVAQLEAKVEALKEMLAKWMGDCEASKNQVQQLQNTLKTYETLEAEVVCLREEKDALRKEAECARKDVQDYDFMLQEDRRKTKLRMAEMEAGMDKLKKENARFLHLLDGADACEADLLATISQLTTENDELKMKLGLIDAPLFVDLCEPGKLAQAPNEESA